MARKMLLSLAVVGLSMLASSTDAQLSDPFGTTADALALCVARPDTNITSTITDLNEELGTVTLQLLGRKEAQETLLEDLKALAEPGGTDNWDAAEYAQEYGMTLIPYSAPGLALFALALLVCPCFFVARCCCAAKCCNSQGPFSKPQIWLPLVFYMIFSTLAMGLAFASVYQVTGFVDGIVGGVCELEGLVSDSSDLLDSLKTPVDSLAASVAKLQNDTETRFSTQDDIVAYSQTLLTELDELATLVNSGDASGEVDAYSNIEARVDAIKTELEVALLPLIEALDTIRVETVNALGEASTGLNQFASSAASAIDGLAGDAQETIDPVLDEAKDSVGEYRGEASSISYYFYSIVFVAFGAGILVLITALTPTKCDDKIGYAIFSFSWACTYLFMLLMFLLSGVLLPLSLVSSDVCAIIGDIPKDVNTWVEVTSAFNDADRRRLQEIQETDNFDQISQIVEGCFATPSVAITASLNLTDAIDLESFYAEFEAGDLPSIENATSVTTFEDLADEFADDETAANPLFQPTLDQAQTKLDEIAARLLIVQAAATSLNDNIGTSLIAIKGVADEVRDLDNIGSCDFLSLRYNNLIDEVCDGSVAAVSTLSFFGFAIGVCGIPMLITSILISNRIFHYEEMPVANYFAADSFNDGIQLKDDTPDGNMDMTDMDYNTYNPQFVDSSK